MKKILLPVFITSLSFSMMSCAASFDCAKAASNTEKLICSNPELSKLDEQLGASYKKALENSEDKDATKKTQVEWLKQQRACKDTDCLKQAYQTRINVLNKNDIAPSPETQTSSSSSSKKPIRILKGGELPLCNAIYNLFAVQHKANELSQSVEPLLAIKGVTLPEWKEISEEEFLNIVDPKLINDPKAIATRTESHKKYPNFKNYRVKINYDSQGADEYAIKGEFNDPNKINSGAFLVLQDEHTLYKNYAYSQYGRLFLYKGETYFISASVQSIGIYKPTRFDEETIVFSIPTICNIE